MTRRSREGSVYRSPDGSGWIAGIELSAFGDGRRRRMKRRAPTRAQAQRLLREMRGELDQTGTVGDAQRTIADSVDAYLAMRATKDLVDGSRHEDAWLAKLIVEGLGRRRTAKLTVLHCDEFLLQSANGLGDRRPIGRDHMGRLRRCLIRVLNNEMRVGRLGRNVAELSILPAGDVAVTERRALRGDELRAMLSASSKSRLILIDLCGRNGLRPAEARALRWSDLDLSCYELSVRGQQDRQNNRVEVKKAHNAARTIPLDETTVNRLKAWQEEQAGLRRVAATVWQEHDIVASTAVGTPVDRHSFARSIRLLCAKVGIAPSITPYELRHTAISMQADVGRSAWEIADWAGTSEAMISRVYRHQLRRLSGLRPADS